MTAVRSTVPRPYTTADITEDWIAREIMFFDRGLLRCGQILHVHVPEVGSCADETPWIVVMAEVSVPELLGTAYAARYPEVDIYGDPVAQQPVPDHERVVLTADGSTIVLKCRADDLPADAVGRRVAVPTDATGSVMGRLLFSGEGCAESSDSWFFEIDHGNESDKISGLSVPRCAKVYLY